MSDKLFIPILLGTPRQGRQSENVAQWVLAQVGDRSDIETQLFDVREFDLAKDGYGQELKDQFPKWREAVVRADGLIIVSPEYNHSIPGTLKSVLDLLLKEYIHKAVGMVSVSAGAFGGARMLESFLPIARELGLVMTFTDLSFPKVQEKFDDHGKMLDESYSKRVDDFLRELTWMARTLKWGRENIPLKHY